MWLRSRARFVFRIVYAQSWTCSIEGLVSLVRLHQIVTVTRASRQISGTDSPMHHNIWSHCGTRITLSCLWLKFILMRGILCLCGNSMGFRVLNSTFWVKIAVCYMFWMILKNSNLKSPYHSHYLTFLILGFLAAWGKMWKLGRSFLGKVSFVGNFVFLYIKNTYHILENCSASRDINFVF